MTARSRAEYRFFQRQPHRLGANRVDQAQYNHLVGEQLKRPVTAPARWVGAGEFDQFLFSVSFDLDLVWPRWPWFRVERRVEPLGDEPLPDSSDGPGAGVQGRDDILVAVPLAMYRIRQEQDSGMSQLSACSPASRDQAFQRRPFIGVQSNPVLFHCSAPSLEVDPSTDAPKKQESVQPVNLRLSPHQFLSSIRSRPIVRIVRSTRLGAILSSDSSARSRRLLLGNTFDAGIDDFLLRAGAEAAVVNA
jgi:hypothetical protein